MLGFWVSHEGAVVSFADVVDLAPLSDEANT